MEATPNTPEVLILSGQIGEVRENVGELRERTTSLERRTTSLEEGHGRVEGRLFKIETHLELQDQRGETQHQAVLSGIAQVGGKIDAHGPALAWAAKQREVEEAAREAHTERGREGFSILVSLTSVSAGGSVGLVLTLPKQYAAPAVLTVLLLLGLVLYHRYHRS